MAQEIEVPEPEAISLPCIRAKRPITSPIV